MAKTAKPNFSNIHNHVKNRGKGVATKPIAAAKSTMNMKPKKPTVLNFNSIIKG